MTSPVSNAAPAYPTHQSAPPPKPPAPTKPQTIAVTDTVKLSPAAQALQEATETAAQTTKEANHGDIQARKLLAKEAAAKVPTK